MSEVGHARSGVVARVHVVKSGPGGEDLATNAWQRLRALPDSRTGTGAANLATIRAAIRDAGYLHVPRRPARPHPRRDPPPPQLRSG